MNHSLRVRCSPQTTKPATVPCRPFALAGALLCTESRALLNCERCVLDRVFRLLLCLEHRDLRHLVRWNTTEECDVWAGRNQGGVGIGAISGAVEGLGCFGDPGRWVGARVERGVLFRFWGRIRPGFWRRWFGRRMDGGACRWGDDAALAIDLDDCRGLSEWHGFWQGVGHDRGE